MNCHITVLEHFSNNVLNIYKRTMSVMPYYVS